MKNIENYKINVILILIFICVISFITISTCYFTDEYIDFNKSKSTSFVIKHKIYESAGYKISSKYIFICKNLTDNKICTIKVTPLTYTTNNVNDIVTFNISKRTINLYSETDIYKPPFHDYKSIVISVLAIITLVLLACEMFNNVKYKKILKLTFFLFLAYCLFLIIRNLFFIS